MSDIKITERDPYEPYRDGPLNVNDPKGLADLKMSPLSSQDSGKELLEMKHMDKDELADLADKTSRSLRGASNQQVEAAREFLHQRGVTPPRRRFYSYGK